MSTQVNKIGWLLLAIPMLLLIPLVALIATDQMSWSPQDFLIMGLMLLATVMVIYFVNKKVSNKYRGWLIFGALLIFFLIWAEMGVGLLGSSFAGD